jgi:hypothetical protein
MPVLQLHVSMPELDGLFLCLPTVLMQLSIMSLFKTSNMFGMRNGWQEGVGVKASHEICVEFIGLS